MNSLVRNASFHHIEVPCRDLVQAEEFYSRVFGASVYMRRDIHRRSGVPAAGTIHDAEAAGFEIDGTYLKIGERLRIGFLKQPSDHQRREVDHLAFAIDDDLDGLDRKLAEAGVDIIDRKANHMLIRDPFGMALELWPRSVLEEMGLI